MNITRKEYLSPYVKIIEIVWADTMLTSIVDPEIGGGSDGEMEEGGEI